MTRRWPTQRVLFDLSTGVLIDEPGRRGMTEKTFKSWYDHVDFSPIKSWLHQSAPRCSVKNMHLQVKAFSLVVSVRLSLSGLFDNYHQFSWPTEEHNHLVTESTCCQSDCKGNICRINNRFWVMSILTQISQPLTFQCEAHYNGI